MMFSSNQELKISGCLKHDGELEHALRFALEATGDMKALKEGRCRLVYQVTKDGRYCIGICYGDVKNGWNEYPFKFDISIVSQIIIQHLEQFPLERGFWDGGYYKGFLMEVIPECLGDEIDGIKEPFIGVVSFKPFSCFYSK